MTRKEYENEIREKIFDIKNEFYNKLLELHKELMAEFKEEEPSFDGWCYDEVYYYIDDYGDVLEAHTVCWNKGELYGIDRSRLISNNMFRTEQEAKFKRERDAVLYELSKFAEPKDREWDGFNEHWYMYWSYIRDKIEFDFNCKNKHNDIYFASKEDVEKAIDAVGEERVKRFYLGVDV